MATKSWSSFSSDVSIPLLPMNLLPMINRVRMLAVMTSRHDFTVTTSSGLGIMLRTICAISSARTCSDSSIRLPLMSCECKIFLKGRDAGVISENVTSGVKPAIYPRIPIRCRTPMMGSPVGPGGKFLGLRMSTISREIASTATPYSCTIIHM